MSDKDTVGNLVARVLANVPNIFAVPNEKNSSWASPFSDSMIPSEVLIGTLAEHFHSKNVLSVYLPFGLELNGRNSLNRARNPRYCSCVAKKMCLARHQARDE